MILDRTWNKKEQKLTISYIDKNGKRKFHQKFLHHIKSYEYDKDGEFETWDGKRCRKVYKDTANYTPNDFEILEYMYELDPDLQKEMHAQYFPDVYFMDIETEYSNSFPYPSEARFKITALSLVNPNLDCIVYGLNDMSDSQKETFRQRYLEWIHNNEFAVSILKGKEPRVLYQYFKSEADLLEHWWTNVVPKCVVIAMWNGYVFDLPYMTNRTINVFGRGKAYELFKKASPTGEIMTIKHKHFNETIKMPAPNHVIFVDYMELCKQYDYILRPYQSYSLDWVSQAAINAHKIEYEGGLQQLYERDHEWYYFYNAIDSCLGQLIHKKLKPLESPCAVSSVTYVPLLSAMGQVALTNAGVFMEFYNDGKKVVYEWDDSKIKQAYDGAFCGCVTKHEYGWGHCLDDETEKDEYYKDPITGELKKRIKHLGKALHIGTWADFCVCDDFASLYPSQVITCNFSFENMVQKKIPHNLEGYPDIVVPWSEQELDEFRKDPNYFVSVRGTVYKNERDYAFRRFQKNKKELRNVHKYLAQDIDAELISEIDRLIKEKENPINSLL